MQVLFKWNNRIGAKLNVAMTGVKLQNEEMLMLYKQCKPAFLLKKHWNTLNIGIAPSTLWAILRLDDIYVILKGALVLHPIPMILMTVFWDIAFYSCRCKFDGWLSVFEIKVFHISKTLGVLNVALWMFFRPTAPIYYKNTHPVR